MNNHPTFLKNNVSIGGDVLPVGTQVVVTGQSLLQCEVVVMNCCLLKYVGRKFLVDTQDLHHNWIGRKLYTTRTLVVPPRVTSYSGYTLTDYVQPWDYLLNFQRMIRKGTEVIVDGEIMLGTFAVTTQTGRIVWRVLIGREFLADGVSVTN